MVKPHKDSFEENIEECVNEIKSTVEKKVDSQEKINRKRDELIRLAED